MKLRLRNNSVRLRLTQTEVTQLRDTGMVEESVEFAPHQRLVYRITARPGDHGFQAQYGDGDLLLSVPQKIVAAWADSSQVGIGANQLTGDGHTLRLLIEKDFQCLGSTDPEENADTFPNPLEGC